MRKLMMTASGYINGTMVGLFALVVWAGEGEFVCFFHPFSVSFTDGRFEKNRL
jgi:hypothetical protein